MKTSFISTEVLSNTLRSTVMQGQISLSKATTEATTGRHADIGESLAALTGRDFSLRSDLERVSNLIDTNEIVAGRLSSTQEAMTSIIGEAQSFMQQLLAARDTNGGAAVVTPNAQSNMASLVDTLNTTLNGQYLFGGINTGVPPMTPYTAGSTSQNAIDAAFLGSFGFNQSSPNVANITSAQMQTFLSGSFAAEFQNPAAPPPPTSAWGNWSAASSTNTTSQISTTQTVQTSTNANVQGFRDIAAAYTMVLSLGGSSLSQSTWQTVVDNAVAKISGAVYSLSLTGGQLGTAQQQITDASNRMAIQKDLFTGQINKMEAVDPTTASVRVNSLQSQIEMAMSLTSQLHKLNLDDYL
jgi:flagellar hook-associated protein 3 FlgL